MQSFLRVYFNASSTKSVFSERSVAHFAEFVAIIEFFDDSLPQYAFAFAVNENDFATDVAKILVHDAAEIVNLIVEDVGFRQSGS